MKKCVFILTVIILLEYSAFAVFPQSISDLQKRQNQINSNISDTQSELNRIRGEKGSVEYEIYELDMELAEVSDHLILLGENLDRTNAKLAQKEEELRLANEDRDNQYDVLKKRIRFIYEQSAMGYLDVLFRAKNFSDFLNRVEYINRIIKYDQGMVVKLTDIENLISQRVDEIAYQKRELEFIVAEQTRRQNDLNFTLTKKQDLFNRLDSDETTAQNRLESQRREENEIKDLIAKAQAEEKARREAAERARAASASNNSGTFASSSTQTTPYTGKMNWPVQGYYKISDTYRTRNNPVNGKREFHAGVDIPAPVGTNIVAAESGTVIYAGWRSGYGNVVILDHGNGMTTVYGHNSRITVGVGQQVSKGSPIAKCGSTGNSTGNHCHFEVRINGNADNPKGYLGY